MAYQIDQSGKIEQTSKATIVTLANDLLKTVKISAVEKRKLIKVMVELDYPRLNYMQKMFAALVFILIKNTKLAEVIVDKEYPSHEPDIKNMILSYFEKSRLRPPEISFGLVGKKAKAHTFGIKTYRGRRKPDLIIKAEDLLKVIYSKAKEKGRRSQSSRDNP